MLYSDGGEVALNGLKYTFDIFTKMVIKEGIMDVFFGIIVGLCLAIVIAYTSWQVGVREGYRAGAEAGYDEGFTDGENSKTIDMPTTTGGFFSTDAAIRNMSKRGDE